PVVQPCPSLYHALAVRHTLADLLGVPLSEQLHRSSSRAAAATARQAAMAVSMSWSVMSTWVTIRTLPDTKVAPTPRSSSRAMASSGSIPTDSVSAYTMFVSTAAGSSEPGRASA